MSGKDGGWRLPDPVDPENRLAVCICIPDEDNHIRAFWGALQELGYWFNWERDSNKTGLAASVLWNSIVQTAYEKFNEGVMCGSCEEFTACLAPLMAAVTEINNRLIDIQYGNAANEPHELTETELNKNLVSTSNPTCDKDILWSQALAVVETTNEVLVQAFQVLETDTNVIELVNSLAQVPIADEFGLDAIASLISSYQNAISENYDAAYSPEYRNELACLLFCAGDNDCAITVNRMWDIILERALANIPGVTGSWGDLIAFINDLLIMDVDSANVADFAFLLTWGVLKFGNFMNPFLKPGNRSIELAILLAADEPSNDWELICEECPDCTEPVWNAITPDGFPGGTEVTTLVEPGKWLVQFVSSEGADGTHRIAFNDLNLCCWKVLGVEYSLTPDGVDAHYECGSAASGDDYTPGSVATPVEIDTCIGGIVASHLTLAFEVAIVLEAC